MCELPSKPLGLPRFHEIDALRSIALFLLIFYHVLCAFQPFASRISIIGYTPTLENAWFLGELLNTWRIPILFLIGGLMAGHLLQDRSVGSLIKSRLMRLVPPLLFTCFCVAPLSSVLFQVANAQSPTYAPTPGHLWFVWNMVVYFVFASPLLIYLKHCPDSLFLRALNRLSPWGWLILLPAGLMLTTYFFEPHITYDLFGVHFIRFWYGFVCFLSGIVLVSQGDVFWRGIRRVCHVALPAALGLYLARLAGVDLGGGFGALTMRTMESAYAMLAALGYASLCFSRPSGLFAILNRAIFGVYIVHFPVQQFVALFLFRLDLNSWVVFTLHLVVTLLLSALVYALILRTMRWLHPFIGIAPMESDSSVGNRVGKDERPRLPWPVMAFRVAILYTVTPILVLGTIFVMVYTAKIQARDSGEISLREAIFHGDINRVQEALEDGADVNRIDVNGWSDFSMAVFARNPEALRIMLNHNPDLLIRGRGGQTLLWAACWVSSYECARILVGNRALTDSLTEEELQAISEALRLPYEITAAQIGAFLEVPSEADYLWNRARIQRLLEQEGLIAGQDGNKR